MAVEEFSWMPEEKLAKFNGTHPKVMKDRIECGSDSGKIQALYK